MSVGGLFKIFLTTRVVVVGSIHQYSLPLSSDLHLTNAHQDSPRNLYGLTKSFNKLQAKHYRMQGLHVSFVCLFNHDSKYHSRNYILPKLCAHAAHVSAFCLGLTSSEPSILNIRNTRDRVDWSNAWWTCRMLLRIGLYSKSDEYILGSGSLNSISQVIGHLTLFHSTSLRNYISCSCVTNSTCLQLMLFYHLNITLRPITVSTS